MNNVTGWLHHWLVTGDAILFAILLMIIEAGLVLAALKGRSGALLTGLIPGVCLAFALYAAVTHARVEWIGLWLTLALPAHLTDLRARYLAARD